MNLNLPKKRCSNCVMPEVPGHVTLDSDGICNLCRDSILNKKNVLGSAEKTPTEMQNERTEIFKRKIERFRSGKPYGCAVSVSGGKDSIATLYIAKKMGLNPLGIFIDNGFALPEMYENIKNASDILETDLICYKTPEMKKIFRILLESGKNIYYCRVCHIILDIHVRKICSQNNIGLILGGYTKGQEYIRQKELSWIFKESDANLIDVISKRSDCEELLKIVSNPVSYCAKHFGGIVEISPFKYLPYNEDKILKTITGELKFKLPEKSWPKGSANCSFNYLSQYLAMSQFGYSQHESELSTLVRCNEMSRYEAEDIINTPIPFEYIDSILDSVGIKDKKATLGFKV